MKLGLGLSLNKSNTVAASFDVSTQAVFTYAQSEGYTGPSDNVKAVLDTSIIALKDAGIWNKIDILYVFATDGDRDFAKINIKNPGSFVATEIDSPTFTSKKGFRGNPGSLETGWSPLADGVNYTLNDASHFTWSYEAQSSLSPAFQYAMQGDLANIFLRLVRGGAFKNDHQVNGPVSTFEGQFAGLRHAMRVSSTNVKIYANGVLGTNNTSNNSSSLSATNLTLCEYVDHISFFGCGSNLEAEATDLYSILNTYISSL